MFNSKLLLISFANLAVLAVNILLFAGNDKPVPPKVEQTEKTTLTPINKETVVLPPVDEITFSSQFTPVEVIPLQIQILPNQKLLVERENEKLLVAQKIAKQQATLSHLSRDNRRLVDQMNKLQAKVEKQYRYITKIEKENIELHHAEVNAPALITSDVDLVKNNIESKPDLIKASSSPVADKIDQVGTQDLVTKDKVISPLSGSVEFGFSYEQDNQVTKAINGRLILDYEPEDIYKLHSDFKIELENEDGESTTEKYRWQFQADYYLDPRNSLFLRSDVQRSQFASYDQEDIYTVGYGRIIFDQDKHKFSAEVGPGYRMAIPNVGEDAVSIDEFIVRSRLIYERILSKTLQIKMDAVLEAGHENSTYALSFTAQNKIYRELYLVFDFEYKYTNNVPVDTLKKEILTGMNLLYAF